MSNIIIKTESQIESMRKSARILHDTLKLLKESAKVGMSTKDLDKIAEDFIRSHEGAVPGFKGYQGFPASLCASVNEEVVHGIPSEDMILEDGDIVGLDCGVLYEGMNSDACITVMIGNVDPEIKYFVNTTKKALHNAIKEVKPGNRIGDISAVIEKTLRDQGYAPVASCTGHGVGEELHEAPEILNVGHKNTGPLIKKNMIFAIEPISSLGSGEIETSVDGWTVTTQEGVYSAHFEHTVLVTESGAEILT